MTPGAAPLLLVIGLGAAVVAAASSSASAAPPPAEPKGAPEAPAKLDTHMDAPTRDAVLQALQTVTDPAKLIGFAHSIVDKYPIAAAALVNKAAALQAAARAAEAEQARAQAVSPAASTIATPSAAMPPDATPPDSVPQVQVVPAFPMPAPAAPAPPAQAGPYGPAPGPRQAPPPPAPEPPPIVEGDVPTPPGTWVLATDADVRRDGVGSRYAALLHESVGSVVTETHHGRIWQFRVVSKDTHPEWTTFAKDVRGFVWRPGLTGAAAAKYAETPAVPTVTPQTLAPLASSPSISELQSALNRLHIASPPLVVDGKLGGKTVAAIKLFQMTHGLKVDGIAGPTTQSAIAAALSGNFGPSAPISALSHLNIAPTKVAPSGVVSLKDVQTALNVLHFAVPPLVVDGIDGGKTQAAVRRFQAAYGLKVDAIAGPSTKAAIAAALAQPGSSPRLSAPVSRTSIPSLAAVAQLQRDLNRLYVVSPPLVVDGKLGPNTIAAIEVFQRVHGLKVDGIVGPMTKAALAAALASSRSIAAGELPPVMTAARTVVAEIYDRPGIHRRISENVRAFQLLFNRDVTPFTGQAALRPDGIFGPKTQAALEQVIDDHGGVETLFAAAGARGGGGGGNHFGAPHNGRAQYFEEEPADPYEGMPDEVWMAESGQDAAAPADDVPAPADDVPPSGELGPDADAPPSPPDDGSMPTAPAPPDGQEYFDDSVSYETEPDAAPPYPYEEPYDGAPAWPGVEWDRGYGYGRPYGAEPWGAWARPGYGRPPAVDPRRAPARGPRAAPGFPGHPGMPPTARAPFARAPVAQHPFGRAPSGAPPSAHPGVVLPHPAASLAHTTVHPQAVRPQTSARATHPAGAPSAHPAASHPAAAPSAHPAASRPAPHATAHHAAGRPPPPSADPRQQHHHHPHQRRGRRHFRGAA